MSNTSSIALSGLKAQEFYIDKLASDLANLNTTNYKATDLTFSDVLYNQIQGEEDLFQNRLTPKIPLGTAIIHSSKDFSKGPLKPSQNWNHLAIDGNGFFQVSNEDGNILYTRNSSLSLDEDRYLSQEGMRLVDNIQIPEDAVKVIIQKNGDVQAILPEESEAQLLGTIKLVKILNPESLNSLGSGLYKMTEATAEPFIDCPGRSGLGELLQYQTEGANVDMVNTLMQLTMAQRVYQLNAKAMQIADELEKITNEMRA